MNETRTIVDAPAGVVVGTRAGGVRRFLGIPYAEPPVGALRFAAPRRRARLAEPFVADRHGATPQRVPLFDRTTIPEPSIPGDDTLTADVFAPAEGEGHPVLVWIHGGGYVGGSPASPWFDGSSFARDGVVVVNVSYRLGIDGFGHLPGAPHNRGLRDLVVALEWVRDDIAAFGGDPARVTIAGQSAGGGAVLSLMASPAAEGLFAGALSVSGVDLSLDAAAARASTEAIAAHLGVTPDAAGFGDRDDGSAMRAIRGLRDSGALAAPTPLGPVHGDDVLPEPVADALRHRSRGIPLLLGATDDEFDGGPTPENPDRPDPGHPDVVAAKAAGTRVTDSLFRAACVRAAAARRDGGAPTWLYAFEWPSPVTGGATHCIDVPFLFDVLDAEGVVDALGPHAPRSLATAMHADAVAFVRDGAAGWTAARGVRGDAVRVYAASGVAVTAAGSFDPCLRHLPARDREDG